MSDERASVIATLASGGQTEAELGTVGQTILRAPRPSTLPRLPRLPLSAEAAAGGAEADFLPTGELGRGGMGVVQLARQQSLGREVALKTARSAEDGVRQALVREAQIMGALEHPNVVPVHALGVDDDGAPVLVMKRVEGTSWRALLADPEHPGWVPLLLGHQDRLRAHVEILAQVCRALAFAHDRGVIHRDLKPDNVMIGRFGEVYLLDWGIALRLSERAEEPRGIVGTPGYMAPEMARGDPSRLDARCDVYLLGAVLYEVLAGKVVHDAPDTTEALVSAARGEVPPLPADAPADLAALVKSALARSPDQRLGSAELFREALARFLVSRQAEVLAADARAALARAERAIAAEGPGSAEAYRALVEARFGLTSAQRMRPGDERLEAEAELVIARLVERELALRSPSAARALLRELGSPRPELDRQVEALEAEVAAERSAADELVRSRLQADSSPMARPVWWLVLPIAALGLAFGTYWHLQPAGKQIDTSANVAADVLMIGLVAAVLLGFRRRLFATEGSTRLTLSGALWGVGVVLTDLTSGLSGSNVFQAVAHAMVAGLIGAALVTVLALRELWPAVVVQVAVVVAIYLHPPYAPYLGAAASTANAVIFIRAVQLHARRTRASTPAP